ncbi:MAG TPA: adenylate/guanylate cyclase domain-containing protein, partial [Ornithinibacter sp.]|nr:adenylate/guanylate cyclase domain-containing protein [Ornithinibacter sp.]
MTDLRRHVPPLTLVWDDEAPGVLHRTVDGTLVFADVSGFTALTERLSRQGRIGAEEIVEALNRVFGPMLTIAATRGGELLKFGGDALLFLFRGEGHPEQACDAAVEMRASLRAAAAVPTSAGRFSLSMSVGVHAGDIELFLVGSPTRELLVLGPGASAVAKAEKAAEAGQVVVSPATANRLPGGSTRPRDDGALLLRRVRPRTVPGHPAPAPPDVEQRMPTLFPIALGEFLAPGPPDPEHRVA